MRISNLYNVVALPDNTSGVGYGPFLWLRAMSNKNFSHVMLVSGTRQRPTRLRTN